MSMIADRMSGGTPGTQTVCPQATQVVTCFANVPGVNVPKHPSGAPLAEVVALQCQSLGLGWQQWYVWDMTSGLEMSHPRGMCSFVGLQIRRAP